MFDFLHKAGKSPEPPIDQKAALRRWTFGACAVLLSAGAALNFLYAMFTGISSSGWIGLGKHQAELAAAQTCVTYWLRIAACCWGASTIAGALATRIYEDAEWLPRLIARLVLASAASFVLAVLIGLVSVPITNIMNPIIPCH